MDLPNVGNLWQEGRVRLGCGECGAQLVDGYMEHNNFCTQHPEAWTCVYCAQRFGPAQRIGVHEDNCPGIHGYGDDDEDGEGEGDDEDWDEDDEPAEVEDDEDEVPEDYPVYQPPDYEAEKRVQERIMSIQTLQTNLNFLKEQAKMAQEVGYRQSSLWHTMSDAQVAKARAFSLAEGYAEDVYCGNPKCPICVSASESTESWESLQQHLVNLKENQTYKWGRNPYKKGDMVHLFYDTEQPVSRKIADVVSDNPAFVNGAAVAFEKDNKQVYYDIMWVAHNSNAAVSCMNEFDSDPERWCSRGYAPDFISKLRDRDSTSSYVRAVLSTAPFFVGDSVYTIMGEAVVKGVVDRTTVSGDNSTVYRIVDENGQLMKPAQVEWTPHLWLFPSRLGAEIELDYILNNVEPIYRSSWIPRLHNFPTQDQLMLALIREASVQRHLRFAELLLPHKDLPLKEDNTKSKKRLFFYESVIALQHTVRTLEYMQAHEIDSGIRIGQPVVLGYNFSDPYAAREAKYTRVIGVRRLDDGTQVFYLNGQNQTWHAEWLLNLNGEPFVPDVELCADLRTARAMASIEKYMPAVRLKYEQDMKKRPATVASGKWISAVQLNAYVDSVLRDIYELADTDWYMALNHSKGMTITLLLAYAKEKMSNVKK